MLVLTMQSPCLEQIQTLQRLQWSSLAYSPGQVAANSSNQVYNMWRKDPQGLCFSSEPPDVERRHLQPQTVVDKVTSKWLVFKEPLQWVSWTRQLLPFPLVSVLWLPQWAGLLSRNQGRNNNRTYCLALVLKTNKQKTHAGHLIIPCFLGCKFSGNR